MPRRGAAGRGRDEVEAVAVLLGERARFGRAARRRKIALLEACARVPLRNPRALRAYHDLLLFMAAHPDDATVLALVEAELGRVASAAAGRARALWDSGIAGTTVEVSLTLDGTAWLAGRFAGDVEIAWEDGSAGQALDELLQACIGGPEADGLLDERLSTQDWVSLARGPGGGDLAWLLRTLRGLPCPPPLLDRLFETLELHVRWKLSDRAASRTFIRLPQRPIFHQSRPFRRSTPARNLLDRPLPAPARLSAADARGLIETARATLAVRQRETDPVTYASEREVTLFRLERGVDVALFGMQPQRRLPIESYFGYLAARNRVPIAYGGGWVFFDRCEIGVNVFEGFRGGESAFLFAQILRVYRQHYGARCFLVDPFQFGAGNSEAIRSGAFWFYHRLGFRPVESDLASLARGERARIRAERSYRTPAATLRRLATAHLALDCGRRRSASEAAGTPDLRDVALAVTAAIGARFGGDRSRAERWAVAHVRRVLGVRSMRGWPREEREAFARLSPLMALIGDLERWPRPAGRRLADVMRAKGGPRERDYARKLRQHARLRRALLAIAAAGLSAMMHPARADGHDAAHSP